MFNDGSPFTGSPEVKSAYSPERKDSPIVAKNESLDPVAARRAITFLLFLAGQAALLVGVGLVWTWGHALIVTGLVSTLFALVVAITPKRSE